jgi:hypothetical protein
MRFTLIALVVGLVLALPQVGRAEDQICPGVDIAVRAENEARDRATPDSRMMTLAYALETKDAAKDYLRCAENWGKVNTDVAEAAEGYAKYEAASRFFTAAKIEHDLDLDYKNDLETAWQAATESVAELLPSKFRDKAKLLVHEIEHLEAHP